MLYGLWHFYYVMVTLNTQLKDTATAYVVYNRNFTDTTATKDYLVSAGLSDADATVLLSDTTYGWGSWAGVKKWVVAQDQVNKTGSTVDGEMDFINNHFQIEGLDALVAQNSLLYNLTTEVYADMNTRYGSNDAKVLANLQFTELGVLGNLPLGMGSVSGSYGPSFLSLNSTMGFPELKVILEKQSYTGPSYYPISSSMLEIQHTFPKNNTRSLVNYNNIISFFSYIGAKNYTAIMDQFQFNETQITPMASYIAYISGQTDFFGPTGKLDGYSTALAVWSQKAWVNSTNFLTRDSYYGLGARLLFCDYVSSSTSCETVMTAGGAVSSEDALLMCQDPVAGWDLTNASSFQNLELWAEAAMKNSQSLAYKALLKRGILDDASLTLVLYTGLTSITSTLTPLMQSASSFYNCSKAYCTYDELLQMQWGASAVTNNLMPSLVTCNVAPTLTMQDWFPTHYKQPAEWKEVSDLPMTFSSRMLSYDGFLSPVTLRMFFNEYFMGNYTKVAADFGFPNTQYVLSVYQYLKTIIPGSCSLFITRTANELMRGYPDPFTLFMYELEIYEGGYPTNVLAAPIASQTFDTKETPRDVMYTGLSDSKKVRKYAEFYGNPNLIMFSSAYSEYTAYPGITYGPKNIWNGTIPIKGSDGGAFGTHVDTDDIQYVYIDSFRRWVKIEEDDSENYHKLKLHRYHVVSSVLQTAAKEPENYQFNQYPHGFDGFMNFTSQLNTPLFISLLHCYLCEEAGQQMAEHYAFSNTSYMSERIYTHQKHDESYVYIEPYSGTGVRVLLSFTANLAYYRDYFFDYDFYEPVAGKGLYFPYYSVHRSFNYSYDQVQDQFSALINALEIQPIARYVGLSVGGFLIVVSLAILTIGYRRYRRHKRKLQDEGDESPLLSPYWLSPDSTPLATPRETVGAYE